MTPRPRRPRAARRIFGPDPAADVQEELSFHLDERTEALIHDGWPADDARREAERQFGELNAIRRIGEQIGGTMERRRRLIDYMRDGMQDLRYAGRTLLRERGFAMVAILVLALAIGANVATFSVVNTLLLRPLPFPNAEELVWISPPPASCGLSCATYSADAYTGVREANRSLQDLTGYFAFSGPDNLRLEGNGDPSPATGLEVIANFFDVLGVHPMMGRTFTADDARAGARPVAVLSHTYWRRQFGGDPAAIGRAAVLNGRTMTIVGVLPPTFDFGAVFAPGTHVDLFAPLDLVAAKNWGNIVTLVGRMRDRVSLEQVHDDLSRVAPDLYFNTQFPETRGRYRDALVPTPLKAHVSGQWRRPLLILWSAVGLVLLIACVNLSNLLLVRAAARTREFAMRRAIGATRGRLVRQALTESTALAAAGTLLGLAGASAVVAWVARQEDLGLPLLHDLAIDGTTVVWTVAVAALAVALFSLLPALAMTGGDVQSALKDSGPAAGRGRRYERVRGAMVIAEIGLASVLLVGAGLLLRSFLNVLDVDLGFAPDRAATIAVAFDDRGTSAEDAARRRTVAFQQIVERVAALPGIEAAGLTDYLPLGRNRSWGPPIPKGTTRQPEAFADPLVYVVTPGFLSAMGIHVHGRDFSWSDGPSSPRVAIISAAAARTYWPGEDAVGKVLSSNGDLQVIGVADDVRSEKVEENTSWQIYYPVMQQPPAGARLVVRSRVPIESMGPSVLGALRALNPRQPTAVLQPLREVVAHAVSPRRFFMLLVSAMAALGLVLAALGIHGVIAYSVTRQTRDIGLRMALGASTRRVRLDVLWSTLRLALVGVAIGLGASLVLARLMTSLLFDASPWDVTTYVGMTAVFVSVALVSGYLPARRASRINPVVALKNG